MIVRFKKLYENAVTPTYAKSGDGALDLTATSRKWNNDMGYYEYGTSLSFEVPEGYVGLLFPRSSISNKGLVLSNSVGVLDAGYRGEVTFRFREANPGLFIYEVGDRIGQLLIIPRPKIELEESTELSMSDRGTFGYGSTGS